jgi:hypothetical protein
MLQKYINNLINTNIVNTNTVNTNTLTKHVQIVDIIFEGGLFNGSYQLGFLNYVKQLEKLQLIKVKRLSGCSIGSLMALLYFIDISLEDNIDFVSNIIYKHIKKHNNINFFNKVKKFYIKRLPPDFLNLVNKRLFITYNDISKNKQIVKSTYNNVDDLFETIRRSCAVPYIIDNTLFYNGKYFDGLYPYIFKLKTNRKIINLNIVNINNFKYFISIKNENNNIYRVIEGILDTHKFFSSNFSSNMCSYVNNWSIITIMKNKLLIKIFKFSIFILHHFYIFIKIFKKYISKTTFSKTVVSETSNQLFVIIFKFFFKVFCV